MSEGMSQEQEQEPKPEKKKPKKIDRNEWRQKREERIKRLDPANQEILRIVGEARAKATELESHKEVLDVIKPLLDEFDLLQNERDILLDRRKELQEEYEEIKKAGEMNENFDTQVESDLIIDIRVSISRNEAALESNELGLKRLSKRIEEVIHEVMGGENMSKLKDEIRKEMSQKVREVVEAEKKRIEDTVRIGDTVKMLLRRDKTKKEDHGHKNAR